MVEILNGNFSTSRTLYWAESLNKYVDCIVHRFLSLTWTIIVSDKTFYSEVKRIAWILLAIDILWKMLKLCKVLRSLAAKMGIYELQPGESKFNKHNIGIMVIFAISFVSTTACLLYDNETTLDYEECFFMWVTLTIVNIGYFITILRAQRLFQMIIRVELMVERREWIRYFNRISTF